MDAVGALVVSEGGVWPFAASLRAHLLREGFRVVEVTARVHQCLWWYPTYYSGKPAPRTVFAALREAGFEPVDEAGFEDMGEEAFCGRRGDVRSRKHVAAYARAVESQLVVRLGASRPSAIAEFGALDATLGRLGLSKRISP